MNYRHAFHAGNFADVFKHVVLTRLVEYLKRKDKAFRVIDTHAGAGLYDLSSPEAQKTGEWREGIGKLLAATIAEAPKTLLQPYLDAVSTVGDARSRYPGSPTIVRRLLRRQDRLTAIELQPDAARRLAALFTDDFQTRVIALDGWLALGAQVPPKEKRGLVLVDPPFEAEGEFDRILDGLERAYRRWPHGIYALWYPIKDRQAVAGFVDALRHCGIPAILDIRLTLRPPSREPRLDGCGMIVVNPPFVLADEIRTLLPTLAAALGDGAPAVWDVGWLAPERPPA